MDARDILGIDRSAAPAGPRPRPSKPTIKKPEGMSREVFALLVQDAAKAGGTSSIPLVPTQVPQDTFKEQKRRVVGWEWREFTNAGRDDSLALHHWSKNTDKSTTYTFSRFNKKVKVLSWTDEEYDRHLTHPAWDRTESALLFDLWCATRERSMPLSAPPRSAPPPPRRRAGLAVARCGVVRPCAHRTVRATLTTPPHSIAAASPGASHNDARPRPRPTSPAVAAAPVAAAGSICGGR